MGIKPITSQLVRERGTAMPLKRYNGQSICIFDEILNQTFTEWGEQFFYLKTKTAYT